MKAHGKSGRNRVRPMGRGGPLKIIKGPPIDFTKVVDEQGLRDGDRIVTERSCGNWIWVILDGCVHITRMSPDGPITIARLGEGAFIGNFKSLLLEDHRRSATATASGNTHIGLLDTMALAGEFSSLSPHFRSFLLSLSARMRKITDRAVEVIRSEMVNNMISDRPRLERKGLLAKGVFLIEEGEVHLAGKTPRGPVPLITLEKGNVFGPLPFVDTGMEATNAVVSFSEKIHLYKMDAEELQREYQRLSGTCKNLITHIGDCITMTTRLVLECF